MSTNAVLLMHCPDQPGIIAVVTDFINVNGGNILYLDQHVEPGRTCIFYESGMGFDTFQYTQRKNRRLFQYSLWAKIQYEF